MLYEIFLSMLGNWARAVIDWMLAHPAIMAVIFTLWLAQWVSGKAQLRRLESRTRELVQERVQVELTANPNLSAKQLYEQIYPAWSDMVQRSAWFIPHRWELWPQRASPEAVQERIGFDPSWLQEHLQEPDAARKRAQEKPRRP